MLTESVPFKNNNGTIINSIKKFYYDKNGNIIEERITNNLEGSAASYAKTGYAYDNRNRLVKVITYDNGIPENYTQYYYDNMGNKLRMYTGLSSPLTISGLDNVTGSDTDYSITKYQYDRFGQLIEMIDPLNQSESYTYDLNGNLTQKTDRKRNVHTYTYDGLGRLLTKKVETPDGEADETYTYTYTLTGNRHTSTGGGITTTCQYDALGRLIKETESGGIEKTYTYDAANNRKSFILKQNGQIKTDTSYDYDNMNRLWKVYENGIQTATYTYDANGSRQTLTYNQSGNSVSYAYNLANKLTLLINKKGASTLSSYAYTYYLDGNQATKTDHTGKITTYAYDDLGRLESESVQGEPTITYTYDDYNNRATMTVGSAITSYVYDKNNRLKAESKTNNGISEITNYYYDKNGNQTCKTVETIQSASGSSETFVVYVLEESENQDIVLNEYDGFNQLKKVTSGGVVAEYQYNADGQRTTKNINGIEIRHIWDGQNIAAEMTGNTMTAKYIQGINLIYSEMEGTVNYYLFNGHGDVVQLTNSSGNVVKTYEYDAFGNEKNPDPNNNNVFRYCGEYFDKETGTYYLRARYYDPATSRMLSEDTHWNPGNMIYGVDDPVIIGTYEDALGLNVYTYAPDINAIKQSTNLYVYCGNNPIMYIDKDGEIFMLVTGAIGAVVGGVTGGIYSYVKYGEVRWQNVVGGAAIGGAIGLTGGAATAYLAAGSVTASTGAVMAGMGLTSGVAAGGGTGIVLWSGGQKVMDAAAQFASSNGFKTLEQTATGKLLSGIQNVANNILGSSKAYNKLQPLWDAASLRFVQGAGKQVHVFLNSAGISDTSVFMRIEYQYLKEKGVELIFHLVNGG